MNEISQELGILDIVQGTDQEHTARLEKGLQVLQRGFDVQTAIDQWKETAADEEIFEAVSNLVDQRLPNPMRDRNVQDLRERAHDLGASRGW